MAGDQFAMPRRALTAQRGCGARADSEAIVCRGARSRREELEDLVLVGLLGGQLGPVVEKLQNAFRVPLQAAHVAPPTTAMPTRHPTAQVGGSEDIRGPQVIEGRRVVALGVEQLRQLGMVEAKALLVGIVVGRAGQEVGEVLRWGRLPDPLEVEELRRAIRPEEDVRTLGVAMTDRLHLVDLQPGVQPHRRLAQAALPTLLRHEAELQLPCVEVPVATLGLQSAGDSRICSFMAPIRRVQPREPSQRSLRPHLVHGPRFAGQLRHADVHAAAIQALYGQPLGNGGAGLKQLLRMALVVERRLDIEGVVVPLPLIVLRVLGRADQLGDDVPRLAGLRLGPDIENAACARPQRLDRPTCDTYELPERPAIAHRLEPLGALRRQPLELHLRGRLATAHRGGAGAATVPEAVEGPPPAPVGRQRS
mmetsp:Transcript_78661/g.228297  ORF Transcript_78661/g.228297 Transcript_78661/m.228297 type:complete len:422 (+) Transcript_78661:73-1338(+)